MPSTKSTSVHTVPALSAPIRLKEYGEGIFAGAYTKSALKKAIKKGHITVDGVVATTATFVYGGEEVRLTIPETEEPKRNFDLALDVLFEDEHLAAINKPPGILVSGNAFRTVARALPQTLKPSTLPDATAPHPVHRLDFATTGVLLAGKTASSIRTLNGLFEEKRIHKIYCAVAIGTMLSKGSIDAPIDGKPALTDYAVLASVPSPRFGSLSLVKLFARTGRMHQLRRHLSGIGNPILGDRDYGTEPLILKGKGMYLHAYSVHFEHPATQQPMQIHADLPPKFLKLFPDSPPDLLSRASH